MNDAWSSDMPDVCERCFAAGDDCCYWPYKWRKGIGFYLCVRGHRWTCGWGHPESGDAPGNLGVAR